MIWKLIISCTKTYIRWMGLTKLNYIVYCSNHQIFVWIMKVIRVLYICICYYVKLLAYYYDYYIKKTCTSSLEGRSKLAHTLTVYVTFINCLGVAARVSHIWHAWPCSLSTQLLSAYISLLTGLMDQSTETLIWISIHTANLA